MKNRINFSDENTSPIREVSHSVSMLLDNTFELAELQLKMARLDLNIFMRRATHLAWMLPVALGLLLAGLPVLGFAIAGTLVAAADISMTAAQWIVGGVFIGLSLLLAAIGAIIAMRAGGAFRRSQKELEKNVRWLRQMIVGSEPGDYQSPDSQ